MDSQRKDERTVGEQEDVIDLLEVGQNFLRLFLRYWWIVLVCVICGTAVYGGISYISYKPMYECKTTFTVGTGSESGSSYNFYYSSGTAEQLSNTFPYVLDSEYFRSVLMEKIGTKSLNGTLEASTLTESNVVTMSVVSSSASDALSILNAALEVYPTAAKFVLGDLQFHMIDHPELPAAPYNRLSFKKVLLYGGGAGCVISMAFLGLMALLHKNIKTPEHMKEITSLKCLTAIPQVKFKARKSGRQTSLLVSQKRVPESFMESMRALEIRLEREMERKGAKVLMITSTASGEGKSMVAMNLAEMYVKKGKKVLLIDGDLRKQTVAAALGYENSLGLKEYMEEGGDHAVKMTKQGFWLIGGMKPTENPAGVLTNPNMKKFMEWQKARMDYVIIDTPACTKFQDAALIEEYADALLYIVKYDFIPKQKILEGFSGLQDERVDFLGYVFNHFPQSMNYYGYGRYGYGKYGYGKYGNGAAKYKAGGDKKRGEIYD